MQAGRTFLRMVKTNYKQEQELLGDQSLRRGNLTRAWLHYDNVVNILTARNEGTVSPWAIKWSLNFPVTTPIVNKIENRADLTGRGKMLEEGISRGKLALALEGMGRYEEAHQEYLRAAKIMGIGDNEIGRVKQLVERILNP
jgi:hypothetical protein